MRVLALIFGLIATSAAAQEQVMGVLKDGDVSVSVTWEANPSGVVGRYRVANAGAAQIYVFDRLYRTAVTGYRSVDPDFAWVWLEGDGLLRVAKFVPEVPAGRRVESPEVAYARLLAPGAVLEGGVLLSGKLAQELPYGVVPPAAGGGESKSIVFSVGYAEVDPALTANEITAGDEIVLSLPFDWLMQHQRIVSSDAQALAVRIQK